MNLVAFEFDDIDEACCIFGTIIFGGLSFVQAVLSREPSRCRCNLLRIVVEFDVDEVLTLTLLMSSIARFAIAKYLEV